MLEKLLFNLDNSSYFDQASRFPLFNRIILVEIFDPPIMPSKGLAGLSTIFLSASISSSINNPKHASFIKFTIPYVDACFLCAVPNASMTKISPNCPNIFENSTEQQIQLQEIRRDDSYGWILYQRR